MPRILIAICTVAIFLIGCQSAPPATPTAPPSPTAVAVVAPTDTPTLTPLPPTVTPTATAVPPTPTPTVPPTTGVTLARVNVRQTPSTTGTKLGELEIGQTVDLTGRTADSKWLQINYPQNQSGTFGWILAIAVTPNVPVDSLAVLNPQGTPVAGSTAVAIGPTAAATGGTVASATTAATALATPTLGTPAATPTLRPTATLTATAAPARASGSIIYDSYENGRWQINRVRADGSNLETGILGDTNGSEPALSVGGVLAFRLRNSAGLGRGVVTVPLSNATGQPTVLDSSPDVGYPTWSPDGQNIAFHNNKSGEIFWMSATPGQPHTLVAARGSFRPAWMPGAGSRVILFDGCDGDGNNCYSLHTEDAFEPDPTNPKLLRTGTNGAWSPSGQQIAFQATDGDGNTNIFVANRDGSGVRQVTKGSGHNGLPVWSANGGWLFYRSDQAGAGWAIYAVRIDGTDAYKIVDAPVNPNEWAFEKLAIAP